MFVVLDASAALAVLLNEPEGKAMDALIKGMGRVLAPDLWLLEISNKLLYEERNDRLSTNSVSLKDAITLVDDFVTTNDNDIPSIHGLALKHNLTSYDACYLHVAKRNRAGLITLDKHLIASAHAEGIMVLPDTA